MNRMVRDITCTAAVWVAVFVCLGVGKPMVIPVDRFLDRARFDQARLLSARSVDLASCKTIRGALVNHHALASDLLWSLFQRLATCRPDVKRIVLLSPDHFFQGQSAITTGFVTYEFRKTRLITDDESINVLIKDKIALSDPKLFRREHGVGALIPFIMELFPKAKIVPVVVRSDVSQAEARRLSVALRTFLDDHTLLIVSSDMSHYLPERLAQKKDQETRQAFERLNALFFWDAKDDHLDFGRGVWIALQTLSPKDFILQNRSSSVTYGGSAAYTTSYFTGFWK